MARPALHLAAVLDPSGVPIDVFTTPAALGYLTSIAGREITADDAQDAVRLLHRLNLATIDSNSNVRAHALVQRATRDTFTADQADQVSAAAADALLHLWPDLEPDTAVAAGLRANTATLYAHTGETLLASTTANEVLFRAGTSLGRTGQVAAARDYFQHLLDDMVRVLGPDHLDTLVTQRALARWWGEAGDAAGAAHALQELLDDRLRVLGPDHPTPWSPNVHSPVGAEAGRRASNAASAPAENPDCPHPTPTFTNVLT